MCVYMHEAQKSCFLAEELQLQQVSITIKTYPRLPSRDVLNYYTSHHSVASLSDYNIFLQKEEK